MEKYFVIGGMPAVQNLSETLRTNVLRGHVNAVVSRDVVERCNLPNSRTLKSIMQMNFNNPARPLSIRKISDYLSSQQITHAREYTADYLADAYLLHRVELYSESAVKRRMNPAKYCLNDLGIIIRAMRVKRSLDLGPLLENLVFLHLRRAEYQLSYGLAADNAEVDFIASKPGTDDCQLIEVCYDLGNRDIFEREARALQKVGEAMKISDRRIVTWDDEDELPGGIRVVPVWKFPLE